VSAPSALARRGALAALVALCGLFALLGLVRPAAAHQTSMKQLELRVAARSAELTLRVSADDAISAIGRDLANLRRDELLADPALVPTVTSWVKLSVDAGGCSYGPARAADDADLRFVAVRWRAECPAPITALTLDLQAFFFLDAAHTMVVRLEGQGASLDTVIGAEDSPLRLGLTSPSRSFLRWVQLGMSHIFGGADHLCFVLALLLAVVITRANADDAIHSRGQGDRRHAAAANATSSAAGWHVRSWRQALRKAAILITSFSVAHSLTLIAASLGWVSLPGALVETVIAASILYTAIENAVSPTARWRWMLTFGFGLVHGLGFASALAELLPAERVVMPLLAFNLGVEAGQLLIVIAVLPPLLGLARLLRAHRYRTRWLPLSSILLGSLALMWSVERAFGLKFW
jgi:HupE / UreJ protein